MLEIKNGSKACNYLVEQIPDFMREESTKEHYMHAVGL